MRALTIAGATLLLSSSLAGELEAACQVSAKPVSFGTVDIARGSDSTGEIVLDCDIATPFVVAIAGSGAPGARAMIGPNGGSLVYDLYPDATRSVPWSDGSGSGAVVTGSSNGETTERLTVYARVPVQNAVPAGAYTDSLTVVVSF